MMVFGQKKLQDEVFCVTQERDFFRSKYLEQVSEIQQMKSDMERSRKEILRLRQELLDNSVDMSDGDEEEKKDDLVDQMAHISLNNVEDGQQSPPELRQEPSESADDEEEDDDENGEETEDFGNDDDSDEHADIRQNAAKLLQWANYRTSVTPQKEEADESLADDEEPVECE